MPYSYQSFNGGAAGLSLAVTVPFLLRAHVNLYTNYDPLLITYERLLIEGIDYNWVSDASIAMLTATTGDVITLDRTTPTTNLLVGWTDGSNVDMSDLLTADRQNLYAVQELEDASQLGVVRIESILNILSDVLPYDLIPTVAQIPTAPTNGQRIEVLDSTGIQSFSPLTGMPAGFIGDPGLPVKLVWSAAASAWQWISYSPVDPDNRYARIGAGGGGGGGGGGVGVSPQRTTTSFTTASLAQLGVADFTMNLGKLAELVSVQVSEPSWVRLYRSSAQRAADPRVAPGGPLQTIIDLGDSKPYSENVTTVAGEVIIQNPAPLLQGDSAGLVYVRLIKQSTGSSAVTLTITTLPQEV